MSFDVEIVLSFTGEFPLPDIHLGIVNHIPLGQAGELGEADISPAHAVGVRISYVERPILSQTGLIRVSTLYKSVLDTGGAAICFRARVDDHRINPFFCRQPILIRQDGQKAFVLA